VLHPLMRARPAGEAARNAARVLAHEVRNPLAGIRAAAQLIARGGDNEATELATLICAEVDRIGRLTDRIDPLAGVVPGKPESFNVHEVLERVRALVGPTAPEIRIKERYDPSLPLVSGDFDQLIQAFLNVAKNSVEALAGRGDAEIAFVTGFRPGVHVRSAPDSAARAQLEVQIVDNGPGLHPDIADRLFEPFATTKSGGMGLGLAVVAGIVARHQGRVEVESKPGRTAFRILLPIDPEARE
jgi:two-component system, NtrC family, nitrogen regulation sensor histidine kinase GlnL